MVVLAPFVSHRDPEVFDNPNKFDYKRFLHSPAIPSAGHPASSGEVTLHTEARKRFMKNGKVVTSPVLPFGGGATMCPGRRFARSEVAMLVVSALSLFEFEVDAPTPAVFEVDNSRAGIGIALPANRQLAKVTITSK